jgi:hypothetical protein
LFAGAQSSLAFPSDNNSFKVMSMQYAVWVSNADRENTKCGKKNRHISVALWPWGRLSL